MIPVFILEFLRIHPFNNGNGRMSRLLTLLLLYRAGCHVGKYISMEKLIERTKGAYCDALQESSFRWLEEENNYIPFVTYQKDGEDKDKFYIFDFCGNFEFFRMSDGKPTALQIALQGAIFSLKAQIIFKLQDLAYQIPDLIAFRQTLVDDMVRKVRELNKENFAVRQHLKFVELYSNPDHYATLSYENTLQMRDELAPLITPDIDDARAVRFDALRQELISSKRSVGSPPLPTFRRSWCNVNSLTRSCTRIIWTMPATMSLSISARICAI